MAFPNFLVIGAEKSGTSSLYRYLEQHPQVSTGSIKEPLFFAAEGGQLSYPGPDGQTMYRAASSRTVTNIEDYEALFEDAPTGSAVGEASPMYLYSPEAPARIRHHLPDARLIAVLRQPVDRAYSAFLHRVRTGTEPLTDFRAAFEDEERRLREGWGLGLHYRSRGFYHAQLSRYYELFDRDRIRVYLYEEFDADPVGVARDIFRFLGLDDAFEPDVSVRYNPAGVPRNRVVAALVRGAKPVGILLKRRLPFEVRKRFRDRLYAKPPMLSAELRRELTGVYREDVVRLQGLIGRDLSAWLDPVPASKVGGG